MIADARNFPRPSISAYKSCLLRDIEKRLSWFGTITPKREVALQILPEAFYRLRRKYEINLRRRANISNKYERLQK